MTDKLFQKHLWGLTLPEPFDNVPDRKSTVFLSKYNSNHPSKSTLYAPLLRAIIAYANLQYESENGGTSKCAIGMQGDDIVIAVKGNVLSVRRLYRSQKAVILQAMNPKYPSINVNIISGDMILGKVTAVHREIK